MNYLVEIRSYNLKPGTRNEFDRLMRSQSLPMLKRWGVDVVACGASSHDADSYFLIRAYADLAQRQQSQDAFYGSAEWREGPRAAILGLIENFTSITIEVDPMTLSGLRKFVG